MLDFVMNPLKKIASKIDALPIISNISPTGVRQFSAEEKSGFRESQCLAQQSAISIAKMLQPGWTERQAVEAIEIWLRDHGVQSFFHKPFAWWGDRSRFVGISNYRQFQATDRRLQENEPFILDVAPIVNGYVSDIGFSGIIGEHAEFDDGAQFLTELRQNIPKLVEHLNLGSVVWKAVDHKIKHDGFDNIHDLYPMGVLAHRVYQTSRAFDVTLLNFGWQSYWELASRGIFGQVLTETYEGSMDGIWAVEPHIGGKGWGMKFEELLVVENGRASWLGENPNWLLKRHL